MAREGDSPRADSWGRADSLLPVAVLTFAILALGAWGILLSKRWSYLFVIAALVLGAITFVSDVTFSMDLGVQW